MTKVFIFIVIKVLLFMEQSVNTIDRISPSRLHLRPFESKISNSIKQLFQHIGNSMPVISEIHS